MLEVPVLVIAFNRPKLLCRLLEILSEHEPSRLYVAIDGPRKSHPGDGDAVQECRDLLEGISWPCELQVKLSSQNQGCGRGVASALDWVFSQEDRAIILEDDVRPCPEFFTFCEQLLEIYADDDDVGVISGYDPVPRKFISNDDEPYRFSRIPHIWGWATWQRVWEEYEFSIRPWRRTFGMKELGRLASWRVGSLIYWIVKFRALDRGKIDTWDYQLTHMLIRKGLVAAIANGSLTQNVGAGPDATHTVRIANQPGARPRPDVHLVRLPKRVDRRADAWQARRHFNTWSWRVLRRKLSL